MQASFIQVSVTNQNSKGRNYLGSETFSTIGQQKKSNYALQQQTREDFIKAVTDNLPPAPQYFQINAKINMEGYDSLDDVLKKGLTPLSAGDFKVRMEEDVVALDTRKPEVFTHGFVPGSVNIGLDGRFAEWAGSLLPFDKPIILITETNKEKESIIRLARVGFSRIDGYLEGGFEGWKEAGEMVDIIIDIEPDELAMDIPYDDKLLVVDVRKEVEFADGHVKGAVNIPLSNMVDPASLANIEDNDNVYLHCGGGYRSVIAASLMKRQGIHNLRNILGGWAKIKEEPKIEIEKEAAVLN